MRRVLYRCAGRAVQVLEGRVDHTRVVALVRRGGHLGVVKDYLLAVQKNNLPSVNEAANELHIAEDDYAALDASVEGYDNFDQLKLAEELEVLPRPYLWTPLPSWYIDAETMLCLVESSGERFASVRVTRAGDHGWRVPILSNNCPLEAGF